MSTPEQIINDILRREGGFVNDPSDRGGPTNHGITQATLSQYLRRPATIEDVRALTVEQAREIYMRNYYLLPRFDTLPEEIRAQVVDTGVNHGPGTAIKMLQHVINDAGIAVLDVDGRLGPVSRDAAAKAQREMGPYLTNALVVERLAFYERLIQRDPSQRRFRRGWRTRALEFWVDIPGLTRPGVED